MTLILNYNSTFPYIGITYGTLGACSLSHALECNAKRMELINGMVIHPNIPYLFWDDGTEWKDYFVTYAEGKSHPYITKESYFKHIKPIPIKKEPTQKEKIKLWKEMVKEGEWYWVKQKEGEFVFKSSGKERITSGTFSYWIDKNDVCESENVYTCNDDEILNLLPATDLQKQSFMTKVGDKWVLTHEINQLKQY